MGLCHQGRLPVWGDISNDGWRKTMQEVASWSSEDASLCWNGIVCTDARRSIRIKCLASHFPSVLQQHNVSGGERGRDIRLELWSGPFHVLPKILVFIQGLSKGLLLFKERPNLCHRCVQMWRGDRLPYNSFHFEIIQICKPPSPPHIYRGCQKISTHFKKEK